jgi:hypothetical protein
MSPTGVCTITIEQHCKFQASIVYGVRGFLAVDSQYRPIVCKWLFCGCRKLYRVVKDLELYGGAEQG